MPISDTETYSDSAPKKFIKNGPETIKSSPPTLKMSDIIIAIMVRIQVGLDRRLSFLRSQVW